MSVLFRKHRGQLSESMKTVVEVSYIDDIYDQCALKDSGMNKNDIEIKPYGYDPRIWWDTYIVTWKDHGIIGFTNGPLFEVKEIG